MAGSIRTVAYYRASTTKQEASIPEQRAWASSAERQYGVTIAREFEDDGTPGDFTGRAGLVSLVEFCKAEAASGDPVEAILCWDADRFSRAHSILTNACLAELMEVGVTKMLTSEGWTDFEDDVDRLMFNIKQDMAKAMYVKSLSKNVTRSCHERALKGIWTGGSPPYGYRIGPDRRLILAEADEVETVRWLFERYATSDLYLRELVEELQSRGACPPKRSRVDPKTGNPLWGKRAVYRILTCPHYTGRIHWGRNPHGKYHTVKGGRVVPAKSGKTASGLPRVRRNPPDEVTVARVPHPALVDAEVFALVQRRLSANCLGARCQGQARRPGKGEWPLTGLLFCGTCGAPMWGQAEEGRGKSGKRYPTRKYICSRYITAGRTACGYNAVREGELVTRIADVLHERFSDPARRAELLKDLQREAKTRGGEVNRQIGRLKKRLATLEKDIEKGLASVLRLPADLQEDAARTVSGWKAERARVSAELLALEAEASAEAAERASAEEALEQLGQIGEVLRDATPTELRDALTPLVERIELTFSYRETARQRRVTWEGGWIQPRPILGDSPLSLPHGRRWSRYTIALPRLAFQATG